MYSFIIDNLKLSYSSINSFSGCKYGWKLNYIDRVPQVQNIFAQFGTLTHDTLEQFFNGTLDVFELSDFYKNNFDKYLTAEPPQFPKGMIDTYWESGLAFFDNFDFDYNTFKVERVEETVWGKIGGKAFSGRPDLIFTNKQTGEIYLTDYKTSNPFYTTKAGNERVDKDKLDGYHKQMYIYSYLLRESKGKQVDKLFLWFTRPEKKYVVNWNSEEEKKAIEWAECIIEQIKTEEEFAPDTSQEFFCKNICGVREHCPHWDRG